ncbi:MAG: hypothetical protein K2L93_00970, partial [Muribaculaceae bacterium]|nr:hypothetical protein [Muribaculaceae bacterium]
MKILKQISVALFFVASIFLTSSCSDDKNNEEPQPVGDEWINPVFAQVLQDRGYIRDARKVTPREVANLYEID